MSDAPAIWRSAVPWSSVKITITFGRVVWAKASASARAPTAPVNATARIQDTRDERLMAVSPAHDRETGPFRREGPGPSYVAGICRMFEVDPYLGVGSARGQRLGQSGRDIDGSQGQGASVVVARTQPLRDRLPRLREYALPGAVPDALSPDHRVVLRGRAGRADRGEAQSRDRPGALEDGVRLAQGHRTAGESRSE